MNIDLTKLTNEEFSELQSEVKFEFDRRYPQPWKVNDGPVQMEVDLPVAVPPVDRSKRCTLSGEEPDWKYAESGKAPQPIDDKTGMHKDYWVLCEDERKKGFVRPVRQQYKHLTCGGVTNMGLALSETYARDPKFYGATFCAVCGSHFPVGIDGEFVWTADNSKVGT